MPLVHRRHTIPLYTTRFRGPIIPADRMRPIPGTLFYFMVESSHQRTSAPERRSFLTTVAALTVPLSLIARTLSSGDTTSSVSARSVQRLRPRVMQVTRSVWRSTLFGNPYPQTRIEVFVRYRISAQPVNSSHCT